MDEQEKVDEIILRMMDLDEIGKMYPLDADRVYCRVMSSADHKCFHKSEWAINPGWNCTRPPGHTGIHVAHLSDGKTVAAWLGKYGIKSKGAER